MGTDDLFKKRKAARKKRRYEFKNPKIDSFLIVTEGTCTEPNYFNGLKRKIESTVGGNVEVVKMPEIDVHGEGMSTARLIEATEKLVNRANIMYQNIWLIFDKDDFTDFDSAIERAHTRGYHVGWSNQSFEYWIFLHFDYSDTDLHRSQWNEKLDKLFLEYGLTENGYDKNIYNIYDLLDSFGGVQAAIANAKRRMSYFNDKSDKPSECRPGTTVYLLVEQLLKYLAQN